MENSKKMNDFNAGEPQVLRKAEIARILNTVKQAPFNADNSKNSENKSFRKRSLLDICLLYTSPSPRDRTRSRMPSSA